MPKTWQKYFKIFCKKSEKKFKSKNKTKNTKKSIKKNKKKTKQITTRKRPAGWPAGWPAGRPIDPLFQTKNNFQVPKIADPVFFQKVLFFGGEKSLSSFTICFRKILKTKKKNKRNVPILKYSFFWMSR